MAALVGTTRSSTHVLKSNSSRARSITSSAKAQRALAFSLNTNNSTASTVDDSRDGQMLRMIMFGQPGAGKGTLSARLVKNYDVVSISTGDLLRHHIAQKTEVGREAKEIVARGDLLPDVLMLRVLTTELDKLCDKHWILDGFPRTLLQGELLDDHLRKLGTPLTLLARLAVPTALLFARVAARYVHPASGRVYNTHFNPPRVPGRDDLTGEPLVQRPDDTPEVYARRLERYTRDTEPLLAYYAAQVQERKSPLRMVTLPGETSDAIWPQLEQAVRTLFPSVRSREETHPQLLRRSATAAKISDAVSVFKQKGVKAASNAASAVSSGAVSSAAANQAH